MKKNTALSIIAILLCFMVGYVAFESTLLLRNWVAEKFSDCRQQMSGCRGSSEQELNDPYGR